jgi:hypothetical protein
MTINAKYLLCILFIIFFAQLVLPASAQATDDVKKSHFLEVSYGMTPSGALTSKPFMSYGMHDLKVNIDYHATPLMEINYGVRKAWDFPIDVSISATRMKTPLRSYTSSLSATRQNLTQIGITNIFSVNLYYDLISRDEWNFFVGGGLGWANFVGAESKGVSASLATGARYYFQSGLHSLLKLKISTVPESKANIAGQQLTLASQVVPMLSFGIGIDF